MTTGPAVLTVFVASPGGLTEERDAVEQIAARLNANIGSILDVRIDIRRFEQLVGHSGAPQEQINPWVDECDIFIGILHRRWGYPTSSHTSGFAEEYERAQRRREETGKPEIYLFFKTVDRQSVEDPGPQLERVMRFRAQIEETRESFYNEFTTVEEFRTDLLHFLVQEMHRRGRVGATGEGYGAPDSSTGESRGLGNSDPIEEDSLQTVFQHFIDVMSGSNVAQPLDFDRLELFALSTSRDRPLLPAHLVNRLFRKRTQLDLRAIEATAWLRTYLADNGRARYMSERVIPYALVAGDAHHLTRQLRDQGASLARDSDALVRQGFLRVAAALRVRPRELWPRTPVKPSDIQEFVRAWTESVQSPNDLIHALNYWLAVHRRGDERRAIILGASAAGEAARLGTILTHVFATQPDPNPLAEAAPELLLSPQFRRRFKDHNPYAAMTPSGLERLCLRYGVPDAVRVEALKQIIQTDTVSASLLARIIDEDHYDSFGYRWERDARALLFDRPSSTATIQQFISVIPGLTKRDVVRDLTARLANHNETVRTVAGEAIRWNENESTLSVERLRPVLTAARGTQEQVPLALSVAQDRNPAMSAYLTSLTDAGAGLDVVEFARQRMKICAIEYLAESPSQLADQSWLDELRLLATSGRYVQHTALATLLRIARARDVELLLEHVDTILTIPRNVAVRLILQKASIRKLQGLLDDDRESVAVSALEELCKRGRPPSRRRALELMRSPDDRLRMIAAQVVCDGMTDAEVQGLIDQYTTGESTYYYNVVCELDRRSSGGPLAGPFISR